MAVLERTPRHAAVLHEDMLLAMPITVGHGVDVGRY
jgi:hypothetical protein